MNLSVLPSAAVCPIHVQGMVIQIMIKQVGKWVMHMYAAALRAPEHCVSQIKHAGWYGVVALVFCRPVMM